MEVLQPEIHSLGSLSHSTGRSTDASSCHGRGARLCALTYAGILGLISLALPQVAYGHVASAAAINGLDLMLRAALLLSLLLYGLGLGRLWRSRIGRGVSVTRASAFVLGWVVLALTLLGPPDRWAERSLAAHVAQHMLLMAFVPPLLLLGLPGPVMLGLLPVAATRRLGLLMRRVRQTVPARALRAPGSAMVAQVAVMWGWHVPAAMHAALRHEGIHWLMHASFLAAGLWFWAGLLRSVREPRFGAGTSAVAIVGTMMAMGLLGALLTFADAPRYGAYVEQANLLGFDALQDQQLAGLIMWVPSALPYLVGGLAILALWLRAGERLSPTP